MQMQNLSKWIQCGKYIFEGPFEHHTKSSVYTKRGMLVCLMQKLMLFIKKTGNYLQVYLEL